MKITAISDIHGFLPKIEETDLFLIGGDICPLTNHTVEFQANWLMDKFNPWLESIPAKKIVCIAGNHDLVFQKAKYLAPKLKCDYLQDSGTEFEGLKIWGSPWSPWFHGETWAFNAFEDKLWGIWGAIPEGTDIVVTHGPPYDCGDMTSSGMRTGSKTLTERIEFIKPKLTIHGHIHEDQGVTGIKDTIVANVSHVDLACEPSHEPMVFEYNEKDDRVYLVDDGEPAYRSNSGWV
jgi:Icc-related predicted phosphoesterase